MNIKHYNRWVKIGLNINYYRKERGLTQQDLADMCSVSRNHMQRVESGFGASVDLLMDIADALNIPIERLFDFRE